MRAIKFRAWDKKERKWLMGYDYPNLGGFSLFGECVLGNEWATVAWRYLMGRNGCSVDDLVVMQFTGLKDKNGKEAYDGEICQYGGTRHYIGWNDEASQWWFYWLDGIAAFPATQSVMIDNEIIGNIYSNPELIEGGTK